jgi:hypothetical protein
MNNEKSMLEKMLVCKNRQLEHFNKNNPTCGTKASKNTNQPNISIGRQ